MPQKITDFDGSAASTWIVNANGNSGILSAASLTADRTFTLPDNTGTLVIGGGTCSGTSSGTNTGDQTSVSGNAGTATILQNTRTIGGSNFNGSADVTSFPVPGPIGGTTPDTGKFTSVTAIVAATNDALKLAPRAGGTGSFIANLTTTTLTADRTITFPDATGTVVLGGGTCSGTSSGTNTGDQTSVSGNAGTATALLNTRTIGGSNFNGTADVTSFPSPGAIGGTTPAAGTFTNVVAIAAATQDAVKLSPRAGGTSSFVSSITTTTLTASRTITLPDATGTVVLGGGTCSGTSSGTNTGDQTSVSGNAGTATALQNARTIGGSTFNGTANVTSFPSPGAIGGTTPAAITCTDLTINGNLTIGDASTDTITQNAMARTLSNGENITRTAAASTAETIQSWKVSDDASSSLALVNGTANANEFAPKFQGVQSGTNVALNFNAQGTTDTGTNPVLLFMSQIGNANVGTRPAVAFWNLVTSIIELSAAYNLQFKGGSTSPTLASAVADTISMVGVDAAAGDRQLYARSEAGQANRLTGLGCRVTSGYTKLSDTTLANITNLTRNVLASEIYSFRAVLFTTSNTSGGIKFAIGGTATVNGLTAYAYVTDAGVLKVPGTSKVTALGSTFGDITAVSAATVIIEGQIAVNAGGTLTIQFAQNASFGTGSTVNIGSYFELISIGS